MKVLKILVKVTCSISGSQKLATLLKKWKDKDGQQLQGTTILNHYIANPIVLICQPLSIAIMFSTQVMNCVTSLLKSDTEVEVRRACVLVITLILKGLGTNVIQVSWIYDTFNKSVITFPLLQFVHRF